MALLLSSINAQTCGIVPLNNNEITLQGNQFLFNQILQPAVGAQALTFSGNFRFDDLTEKKAHPLFRITELGSNALGT